MNEKTENGDPIYRYSTPNDFTPPPAESSIEEISAHIEKHVGNIEMVFHELVSDQVHIDIHWVKPTAEKPFHTLVTSGMSDRPMHTPQGWEEHRYAELSICLPPEWKLSTEDFKDENNYWPVRWLKILARFPHQYNTWLGWGHTIPNGDPPLPLAPDTALTTLLLLPSIMFADEFQQLKAGDKTIHFYALVPIYTRELEVKMKSGTEALFDGFDEHGVTDLLQLQRPCTV